MNGHCQKIQESVKPVKTEDWNAVRETWYNLRNGYKIADENHSITCLPSS